MAVTDITACEFEATIWTGIGQGQIGRKNLPPAASRTQASEATKDEFPESEFRALIRYRQILQDAGTYPEPPHQ